MLTTAIPLALLFSSIMTFGNLGESFELIAIKSAGIPLIRFMRPLFIFAIGLAGIAFLLANNIIPVSQMRLTTLKYEIIVSKPAIDLKEGVAYAQKVNKPILLDFTGYACVNCRKMEEKVWSDPKVLALLKEKYIVVSLYVDDKKIQLSPSEYFQSRSSGKTIKTLGDKNAELQEYYFGKSTHVRPRN